MRGGGWGYLGNGETTDKEFRWYPYQAAGVSYVSMLLDGGAHGGLAFTGHWRPRPGMYGIGSIVHARFAGVKDIKLPRKTTVLDVFNKRIVAKDVDAFSFDAPLHSSWLFYLGDDAEKLAAELSR